MSEEEKRESPEIFIFLKDSNYGLDSIVLASHEDPMFRVFASQDIPSKLMNYVTPYMISRMHRTIGIDEYAYGVITCVNDPYAQKMKPILEAHGNVSGVTYTVAGILDLMGMKLKPHAEHSEPTGFIPRQLDLWDMDTFNKWEKYFEEGYRKHSDD